ncbi:MAG: hypothetical protein WAW11_03445 [Patescibacteria group bacterium]
MKKFLLLINEYLANFWFIILLLTIGCLLVVLIEPMAIVIVVEKCDVLVKVHDSLWTLWKIFLLPLAIISIGLNIFVWLQDKKESNHKGLVALIITLLALSFSFSLISSLINLNYRIKGGDFHVKISEPQVMTNDSDQDKDSKMAENINTGVERPVEKWINTPAEINKVFTRDGATYCMINILSLNPDFQPGVSDFFINKSNQIREVLISGDTKTYICGAGLDGNETTADNQTETNGVITFIKNLISLNQKAIYYFDIENNKVQNIYQQCLP